ncbi:VOC family protein [Prevotella falsenii]|uniref:VOC family protein n=1 Tax=Prevotella falsenii TaxID=515414 RepID=UPI00278C170D|nr:VOC family protein [Prevotella falsenii]
MRIEHLAIWADDIELLRSFYMRYFGMQSNEMYTNEKKGFRSYFLSWKGEHSRIEIMSQAAK